MALVQVGRASVGAAVRGRLAAGGCNRRHHARPTAARSLSGVGVGLVGLPMDLNTSFSQGPADAPAAIRTALASDHWNAYTERGLDVSGVVRDCGDAFAHNLDYDGGPAHDPVARQQAMVAGIADKCDSLSKERLAPIFLGGDHSVTCAAITALRGDVGAGDRPMDILLFDAHPDLYDDLDGNRYSHASPFARLMESRQELRLGRLVQVGIRTANAHQRQQARRFGVDTIPAMDLQHVLRQGARNRLVFRNPVYISIDIDVLDPACAPGVSHIEPGGITTRQLIDLLHSIEPLAGVVGGDVVELNPATDVRDVTAITAAKVVKELAGIVSAHPYRLQDENASEDGGWSVW